MKENENQSANLRKMSFYVCPICGNIITSVGQGSFSCCGVGMMAQEAEEADEPHDLKVELLDGEYFASMEGHPMGKDHSISFLAYVTAGTCEIVKLYPEQDIYARFKKKGHGVFYAYCNKHGMFRVRI